MLIPHLSGKKWPICVQVLGDSDNRIIAKLESPVNLRSMFVICERKPEHPEETQADTEHANSTWKLDMQFNENHKCQPCDVVTRRKLTEHQHHSLKTVYRSITVQSYLSKLVKIFQ